MVGGAHPTGLGLEGESGQEDEAGGHGMSSRGSAKGVESQVVGRQNRVVHETSPHKGSTGAGFVLRHAPCDRQGGESQVRYRTAAVAGPWRGTSHCQLIERMTTRCPAHQGDLWGPETTGILIVTACNHPLKMLQTRIGGADT
jgi:hypothetical protein